MSQQNGDMVNYPQYDKMDYEDFLIQDQNQIRDIEQIQEEQSFLENGKQDIDITDLEFIKSQFKYFIRTSGKSQILSSIKTFIVKQSDTLDCACKKADELLKRVSVNKGYNYEDEVNLLMKMDNLDPYPSLFGQSIELSYLANLNSRFSKVCRIPEFQDIFEEQTIPNYDYSEIRTESNRLTFKKTSNERGEMISYAADGRQPKPMIEVLKLQTNQLKDLRQNTMVRALAYKHDVGESMCIQFKVVLGLDNTNEDLHAIRVDEMHFKELDSEMGSLMWGGSHLGDQNQMYLFLLIIDNRQTNNLDKMTSIKINISNSDLKKIFKIIQNVLGQYQRIIQIVNNK